MKVVVFGSTGYLGSHLTEQLALAGHEVTAVVRKESDTSFVKSLPLNVVSIDFSDREQIKSILQDQDVVYNALARPKLHQSKAEQRAVDVELTRTVAELSAQAKVNKFIQLSTVKVYGCRKPLQAAKESHPCQPTYAFEQVCLEREQAVLDVAKTTGLHTVIVRPAGAIGRGDAVMNSFIQSMDAKNEFPLIGGGTTTQSMVDARDIGRAMVWLGENTTEPSDIFNLKGFETSWLEIKNVLDHLRGKSSNKRNLPAPLASILATFMEKLTPFSKTPMLTRLSVQSLTTPLTLDDSKLKNKGFHTKYSVEQSLQAVLEHHSKNLHTT